MSSHRTRNYKRCDEGLNGENPVPFLCRDKQAPAPCRENPVPFLRRDKLDLASYRENSVPFLCRDKQAPAICREDPVPFLCRDKRDRKASISSDPCANPHGQGCHCPPSFPEFLDEPEPEEEICPPMTKSLVPYSSGGYNRIPEYSPPLKRSMSFLTTQELFSYRAIPAIGVSAYLGSAIGIITYHETFVDWFGTECAAVHMVNCMTATSVLGLGCYIYGRRHIRHAGAFQRMIYPFFGSVFFNYASHFCWQLIKELMRDQKAFDYHWKGAAGFFSGLLFLYTGRSYLKYVDHW